MAHGRKNSRSSLRSSVGREIDSFANGTLPRLSQPLIDWNKQALLNLAQRLSVDDRLFNPTPRAVRPHKAVTGLKAPVSTTFKKGKSLNVQYTFVDPQIAAPCVRRAVRKEVMHAKKLAGKRFGKGGSYRRTPSSDISC